MTFINVFVRVRPDRRRAETDGHREAGDELAQGLGLSGDARPREEVREELTRRRLLLLLLLLWLLLVLLCGPREVREELTRRRLLLLLLWW